MQKNDFYTNAHLFTAAIRILGEQKKQPPTAKDVCTLLSWSLEQGRLVLRRMVEAGILELTTQAFEDRIFIKDHLAIENYKDTQKVDQLDQALEKFQSQRKEVDAKVEAIKSAQQKKQAKLFADLEEQLKAGLGKKKP
jgi:hypothetical protein